MKVTFTLFYCILVLLNATNLSSLRADTKKEAIQITKTSTNVRFGLLGKKPVKPAPTLFIFSGTIEESLGDSYFRQCGNMLYEQGYLCISLDLPCHGVDKRSDEPNGLDGWRYRIDHNESIFTDFNAKVSKVLNYLISEDYTDSSKVSVCGTSRGGFIAANYAAADRRMKCIAMFCPVTDLLKLQEFKNVRNYDMVDSMSLVNLAERLVGRPVWLVIGDQDTRVDTDSAIAFARTVSQVSGKKSQMELHIMPEPGGHVTPKGSAESAAKWIIKNMGQV